MGTVQEYIDQIPQEKRTNLDIVYKAVQSTIPKGFEETLNYNMIGFVVPHSIYPKGYHCDPKLPLPFINVAAQKSHVALYHLGVYAFPEVLKWFTDEYEKATGKNPRMGKSCIRFTYKEEIPTKVIQSLCKKISAQQWIDKYEVSIKK